MKNGNEPDWFDMNLSELVAKSIALGVIPMMTFEDKGKPESHSVPKNRKSFLEKSPIDVLADEINSLNGCLVKLSEVDCDASKKKDLSKKIKAKVKEMKQAIKVLKASSTIPNQ